MEILTFVISLAALGIAVAALGLVFAMYSTRQE